LAQLIPSKSEIQIRNYYQNNKHTLDVSADRKGGDKSDGSPRLRKDGADSAAEKSDGSGSKAGNIMYPMYPYSFPSTVGPDGNMRYGLGVDAAKWAAAAHLAAASGAMPPPFAMLPPMYSSATGGRPGMTLPMFPLGAMSGPNSSNATGSGPVSGNTGGTSPMPPSASLTAISTSVTSSVDGSKPATNGKPSPATSASGTPAIPFLTALGHFFPGMNSSQQKSASAVAAQALNSLDTLARYAISAPLFRPPPVSHSAPASVNPSPALPTATVVDNKEEVVPEKEATKEILAMDTPPASNETEVKLETTAETDAQEAQETSPIIIVDPPQDDVAAVDPAKSAK
jgi:hypothetical protein